MANLAKVSTPRTVRHLAVVALLFVLTAASGIHFSGSGQVASAEVVQDVSLSGQMAFGVDDATTNAPVTSDFSPMLISSVAVEPLVLGAPGSEPVILHGLAEIFEGAKAGAQVLFACAPNVATAIITGGPSACKEVIGEAIANPLETIASAALMDVVRAINGVGRRMFLWAINAMFTTVLGGGDEQLGPANDFQHGAAAPNLSASWFTDQFGIAQTIAFYLVLPLFMLVIIQSIAKGSLFFLIRAATIMLPVSIIGGYAVVEFTRRLLWVSDDISHAIASSVTTDDATLWLTSAVDDYQGDMFSMFALIWMVLGFIAAIAVWLELLLRQMGVYLAAFFLPLGFAALVWPATAKFARRLVELLIGLIFSKVFIVAALSLGLAALGKPDIEVTPTDTAASAPGAIAAAPGAPPSVATLPGVGVAAGAEAPGAVTAVEAAATEQNGSAGALAALTSGVAIFMMAAFAGMKIIEIAPGASAAAEGRLGSPGSFMQKGHVASYGLGKIGGHLQKRQSNIAPQGAKPVRSDDAPPPSGMPNPPSPSRPPGPNSGGPKVSSLGPVPDGSGQAPAGVAVGAAAGGAAGTRRTSPRREGDNSGRFSGGKAAPTQPNGVGGSNGNGAPVANGSVPSGKAHGRRAADSSTAPASHAVRTGGGKHVATETPAPPKKNSPSGGGRSEGS